MAFAALALGALNIAVRYPGVANPDSDLQYAQVLTGRYDDWHPPVMARLWSVLHLLADGTAPLYLVHLATWWLGIGSIAVTLARLGRTRAAWVLLALMTTPPLIALDTAITKDVGLAAALVAAVAIGFAYRAQAVRRPLIASIAAGLLVVYATLVRTNAVFAIGPIAWYLCVSPAVPRTRVVALSIALAILLVPLSTVVNRQMLGAEPGQALRSLQVFDLFGIARLSGADALLGPRDRPAAEVRDCYTPIAWDSTADRCPAIADALWSDAALDGRWRHAIVQHPIAYAEHRLLAFNAMLYLDVPATLLDLVPTAPTDGGRSPFARFVLDLVRTNLFTSPATATALALSLLLACRPIDSESCDAARTAGEALALSAALYAASFLIVGVGTGLRYFLWPLVAGLVATVLLQPVWLPLLRRGDARAWLAISPLLIVIAVQIAARLTGHEGALLR